MPKTDASLTERFEMRASKEWLGRVDEWRRAHPALPSRGEAIRLLVDLGLKLPPPVE